MSCYDVNRFDNDWVLGRIDSPESIPKEPNQLLSPKTALWRIDLKSLAVAAPELRELLTQDELQHAARFHFDRDRLCFTITRSLLRIILAGLTHNSPHDLRFTYSDRGKPQLENSDGSLAFNVSHSGESALIGVSRRKQIGVDIERIREDFDVRAIAQRFFSERERKELFSIPERDQFQAFFQCWTLKESFIKALGEGLSHPLHQFDVSFRPGSDISLCTRPDASDSANWRLWTVDVGPGYAGAITLSHD